MNFETIYNMILVPWLALGAIAFLSLFFITAPYGRHNKKMGPMMSGKWGWFIQEIISPLTFAHFFIRGDSIKTPEMWVFFILWIAHYFNRSIIFPLRQKNAKDTAVIVVLSAILFNIVNGFINGYYLGSQSFVQNQYENYFTSYNFIFGLIIFLLGAYINIRSDEILFNIRKNNNGYKIPQSFLYKYISCPNYFGEIIEWSGFAIMVWNFPSFIFVLWTIFNLVPRAVAHHKWYKTKFEDYPSNRKAIIPFIL
tara:strand:+ start:225 stop:983 length:759 start_codon:yes stop_codon:yes gene_type:complete